MFKRLLLLSLLLWPSCNKPPLALAQDTAIPPDCRVANRGDHGVCWWCCAQMIGNKEHITPLQTIVDRVVETGVGFAGGAGEDDIKFHLEKLNVKALRSAEKSQKGVDTVQAWLRKGLPVIVSYQHAKGQHAVVVTHIGDKKETWTADDGEEVHDFPVDYVDPDRPNSDVRRSWTWFWRAWTGEAYAFDPRGQAEGVVQIPQPGELRPGRLMLSDGRFHEPKVVARAVRDRVRADPAQHARPEPPAVRHVSPPVEVRHQLPPYQPHELPYHTQYPYNYGPPPKIPSNQDIQDGVVRPLDFFANYAYASPDYYAEYEAYRRGPAAPPE